MRSGCREPGSHPAGWLRGVRLRPGPKPVPDSGFGLRYRQEHPTLFFISPPPPFAPTLRSGVRQFGRLSPHRPRLRIVPRLGFVSLPPLGGPQLLCGRRRGGGPVFEISGPAAELRRRSGNFEYRSATTPPPAKKLRTAQRRQRHESEARYNPQPRTVRGETAELPNTAPQCRGKRRGGGNKEQRRMLLSVTQSESGIRHRFRPRP